MGGPKVSGFGRVAGLEWGRSRATATAARATTDSTKAQNHTKWKGKEECTPEQVRSHEEQARWFKQN